MNETTKVQEVVTEEVSNESFMIESIDQFGQLVEAWHSQGVLTLKHLMEVPVGMEIVIEGEEPFKMEGDIQRGYKLGLNVALNYLGTLPFSSAETPDDSKLN